MLNEQMFRNQMILQSCLFWHHSFSIERFSISVDVEWVANDLVDV